MNPARLPYNRSRTTNSGSPRYTSLSPKSIEAAQIAWQEAELQRLRNLVKIQQTQLNQHETEKKAAEKLLELSLPNMNITQLKRESILLSHLTISQQIMA